MKRFWRRRSPFERRLLVSAALILALVVVDGARPPQRQWTVRLERAAIAGYQARISPLLRRGGVRCRFEPSCSHFAAAVLAKDGFWYGNLRIAWRLLRCGPWTAAGTADPP
ncbi:MAG: membrane protein insertion efficiency factor YidD [Thermoanaerobaculia bacterium]